MQLLKQEDTITIDGDELQAIVKEAIERLTERKVRVISIDANTVRPGATAYLETNGAGRYKL